MEGQEWRKGNQFGEAIVIIQVKQSGGNRVKAVEVIARG